MDCPFCRQALAERTHGAVWLAECPACAGVFFDYRRLLELGDRVPRAGEALAEPLARSRVERERPERLPCPKCRTRMRRRRYEHREPVEIEECFGCSSVWFDPGELGALARNLEGEPRREAVRALVEGVAAQFDDTPAGGRLIQSRPQQARVQLRLDLLDRLTQIISHMGSE